MTKSRFLSFVVAVGYLIAAYFGGGWELVWRAAIFLILPLACIWFGDAMGSYTGIGMGRGAITSPTPGWLVALGGWLLLLMPVIAATIGMLSRLKP